MTHTVSLHLKVWALSLQEPTWVVGRVCCDSEGRLNDKSILLEGSREYSEVCPKSASSSLATHADRLCESTKASEMPDEAESQSTAARGLVRCSNIRQSRNQLACALVYLYQQERRQPSSKLCVALSGEECQLGCVKAGILQTISWANNCSARSESHRAAIRCQQNHFILSK